jgi:hypothetical protein
MYVAKFHIFEVRYDNINYPTYIPVRFPVVSPEFFTDIILPAALWPLGLTQPLTEMNTRNISCGGKGGRCLGLTTLPLSCVDCLEIWEPQPPGTLRACPGL